MPVRARDSEGDERLGEELLLTDIDELLCADIKSSSTSVAA
jgi:hypothetical protein